MEAYYMEVNRQNNKRTAAKQHARTVQAKDKTSRAVPCTVQTTIADIRAF